MGLFHKTLDDALGEIKRGDYSKAKHILEDHSRGLNQGLDGGNALKNLIGWFNAFEDKINRVISIIERSEEEKQSEFPREDIEKILKDAKYNLIRMEASLPQIEKLIKKAE